MVVTRKGRGGEKWGFGGVRTFMMVLVTVFVVGETRVRTSIVNVPWMMRIRDWEH